MSSLLFATKLVAKIICITKVAPVIMPIAVVIGAGMVAVGTGRLIEKFVKGNTDEFPPYPNYDSDEDEDDYDNCGVCC